MKIKKIFGMAMAVVYAAGMLLQASAHGSDKITDVSGHWAQHVMLRWQEEGLLSADEKGKLNPDKEITRGEYMGFINKILDLKDTSEAVSKYSDIQPGAWYYSDVSKALAAGYISGTGSSSVSPEAGLKVQEAAVMLVRAAKLQTGEKTEKVLENIPDGAKLSAWAREAVSTAIDCGYLTGTEGRLNPKKIMTRAEAVTMLDRFHADKRTLYFQGEYSLGAAAEVEIAGGGISLSDTVIKGDLITDSSVGNGSVTLKGVTIEGLLKQKSLDTRVLLTDGSKAAKTRKPDSWADGTYSGEAYGYKSNIKVNITVKDKKLKGIDIVSQSDDKPYFNAADCVVDKMLDENSTDVDTVSGATFSSRGIINAVKNALKPAVTQKGYTVADRLAGEYRDGTYEGVARGLYAGLHVNAVIKDNRLVQVTLGDNREDRPYVDQAAEEVLYSMLEMQSAEVDTVSGATYSSKGIINAAKYALNLAAVNPEAAPREDRTAYSLLAAYGGQGTADGDSWFYDVEEVDGGYVATGVTSKDKVSNGIIAKYDHKGSLLWKKLIPEYRYGNIVKTTNGIFLTGYHTSHGEEQAEDEKGEDTNAAAILLSAADGTVIWSRTYGEDGLTADGKARNDAFGQYWMWANNAVEMGNGTIVAGGMTNASKGSLGSALKEHNALLAVLDIETGDLKTVEVFGSDKTDMVASLGKTSDGDLIVAGSSNGTDLSFKDGGWSDNKWEAKVFVMRVTGDLKRVKWTKLYPVVWNSYQMGVVVDSSDNIYTAYSYRSKTEFVTMAKLAATGEEIWLKDFKYADSDYISSLNLGADGHPLLTIESYEGEDSRKSGWLGSINPEKGDLDWSFVFGTNNGGLLFNAVPASDGSIVAAGIEQDNMGYYIADIIRYIRK